ncbi:MAG: hypothetical protein H7A42_01325 [Chlamydiales bacterium]|nr:hypothetical protein [Chlamydiales bacterium]
MFCMRGLIRAPGVRHYYSQPFDQKPLKSYENSSRQSREDQKFRQQLKEVVVIPAANSSISQVIIPKALEKGMEVVALTGNVENTKKVYQQHFNNPQLQFVPIRHQDYADANEVARIVREATHGKTYDRVRVISTLGGTTSACGSPDTEKQLREKNIAQPIGFLNGVIDGVRNLAGGIGVAHLSSIAASISNPKRCTYAKVRREAEDAIALTLDSGKIETMTQLRVGLVQPKIFQDHVSGQYVLNSGHNHSAENWRDYPVVMVGGSDELPLQQPVCTECVAKGALNATARDFGPDYWVVNGVSRQKMTQREYLTYFTKDMKVACIHVPLEVLHAMTRLASDGRLQPYAIAILEALEQNPQLLDGEDFERLLGSDAETLDDIYSPFHEQTFTHEGPRLGRYIFQFLKSSFKNPSDALEFTKTVMFSSGWKLSVVDRT